MVRCLPSAAWLVVVVVVVVVAARLLRRVPPCVLRLVEEAGHLVPQRPLRLSALETIKAAVLSRFPELTDMYDAWWKTEKVSLESAYTEATKADSLEQVKTHLKAAAPFMLATHDRNLDKDCSTISELQYAPKTTDFVESSFAAVDWTTRTLCGASMEACLGVAHAMVLKAFVSDGAKQQASASAARKKRQKTGGTSDSDQAAFAEQLEAWDTTSFFKLPPEERWVVIRDLQYRYKTKCVTEPRERLAKHDAAVVDRLKHKAEEHVRLVMNRVIAYQKHNEIVACVSAAALEALRGKHESDKALAEALRDQIRVRQHVYGMKQNDLPAIGSDSGELAVTRLISELAVVVSEPLPRKPPPHCPTPSVPRTQHRLKQRSRLTSSTFTRSPSPSPSCCGSQKRAFLLRCGRLLLALELGGLLESQPLANLELLLQRSSSSLERSSKRGASLGRSSMWGGRRSSRRWWCGIMTLTWPLKLS